MYRMFTCVGWKVTLRDPVVFNVVDRKPRMYCYETVGELVYRVETV